MILLRNSIAPSCVVLAAVLGIATSAAIAGPTTYSLLTTIAVPATSLNNQGGAMTAFDISYTDPVTGNLYFADRSNASVDVIRGATNTYINQITGNSTTNFTGQQATTSTSGPDGVVIGYKGTTPELWAGNGGSTLLSFNVTNPAAPTQLFPTINTGGTFRVDEMAFSPTTGLLMVANNADTPAFASLINTTSGTVNNPPGKITVSNSPADGGMEQSVWNPNTGTFFVSIPAFNGSNDPGGVAEIDTNGNVIKTFDFGTLGISSCSPAGLALGGSGNLLVGCANTGTQTVVLNPVTGAIVTTIGAISGSDELWYDPVTQQFFATGVNAAGDRVIDVIGDGTYFIQQSIDLTALGANVNAHSVAVNPLNGDIFVPLEGTTSSATDTLCPMGCVAVFRVPEPATLALLGIGLAGLGFARLKR